MYFCLVFLKLDNRPPCEGTGASFCLSLLQRAGIRIVWLVFNWVGDNFVSGCAFRIGKAYPDSHITAILICWWSSAFITLGLLHCAMIVESMSYWLFNHSCHFVSASSCEGVFPRLFPHNSHHRWETKSWHVAGHLALWTPKPCGVAQSGYHS